jgi:hypothetical protein
LELSKKLRLALILVVVFSALFLTVYLAIFFTQSSHSTPSNSVSLVGSMDIALGPPPNSTNVPLDTTITVEAVASAALNDLHITPEEPIARVYSEATSPLTYQNTFYPAQLLQPATTYNVSVTIMDLPVSWTFTTTAEAFSPGISFYLANNVLWISLAFAASATVIFGFAIWFKYRQVLGES